MVNIEPVEFNAESRLWVRLADLQAILALREPKSVDKWRDKLGRQHEHNEKRGPRRGVWIYLPAWLPAYFALRSPIAADPESTKPSPKQRREEARARLDELQVAERERVLDENWASKDEVLDDYMALATVLKATGERMCRGCKQILSDGLSEIQHQHLHRNGSAKRH